MDGDAVSAVVRRYVGDLRSALDFIDVDRLALVVGELVGALEEGRRILIAGNGGSSATASHMASDLAAAAMSADRMGSIVVALADNVARLTAIANDSSYEEVFATQIEAIGRPSDVLVLLSVSGESPNLIAAAEVARRIGMRTLVLAGRECALLTEHTFGVVLGNSDYGLSEDLQLAVVHMTVRALRGRHVFRSS